MQMSYNNTYRRNRCTQVRENAAMIRHYVGKLLATELGGAGSRGPRGRLDTLLLFWRGGRVDWFGGDSCTSG